MMYLGLINEVGWVKSSKKCLCGLWSGIWSWWSGQMTTTKSSWIWSIDQSVNKSNPSANEQIDRANRWNEIKQTKWNKQSNHSSNQQNQLISPSNYRKSIKQIKSKQQINQTTQSSHQPINQPKRIKIKSRWNQSKIKPHRTQITFNQIKSAKRGWQRDIFCGCMILWFNVVYREIGKVGTIFREKNQVKQVTSGQECGITVKDYMDFQKDDTIEAFSITSTERSI